MEMTYELVEEYAKQERSPRTDVSRAKDMSHTFWELPWNGMNIMVLYEGERRTLRGHQKPEVCWICVNEYGDILSIAARHIRQANYKCGFGFNPIGRQKIIDYYYSKENK